MTAAHRAQHTRNELLLIVVILIFGVFVCEYVRLLTGAESMLDSHGSNLPYYLESCLLNNSYQMEFEID